MRVQSSVSSMTNLCLTCPCPHPHRYRSPISLQSTIARIHPPPLRKWASMDKISVPPQYRAFSILHPDVSESATPSPIAPALFLPSDDNGVHHRLRALAVNLMTGR